MTSRQTRAALSISLRDGSQESESQVRMATRRLNLADLPTQLGQNSRWRHDLGTNFGNGRAAG
jgi:hypothetical protein